MKQEIKLSSLKEFESLASLAQELFGVSRNLLKRYDLRNKDKKVHAKNIKNGKKLTLGYNQLSGYFS